MTVATTTNKIVYAGLIGQDTFAYNFRVDEKSHMEVYLDSVIIPEGDWSITNLGDPNGGDVVLNTALTVDQSVTLLRNVPQTQLVDYLPLDAFPAETHEGALDKLTFQTQQLEEKVSRVPQLPVDSPLAGFEIGDPVPNEVVQYNAAGDGIEASGVDVTTFNQRVDDALNAADESEAARDKAQQWAENPEDVPVESGQFSAFHWAQKSEAFTNWEQYLDGYDASLRRHAEFQGDLDTILINSKYQIDSTQVTNEPADFTGLAVIETYMWETDTTQGGQLLITIDDANEGASWIRNREAGAWSAWIPFGSGGGLVWEFPTADFTAEKGIAYKFPAGTITAITLPASPAASDAITFADLGDTWDGTINIDGNGNNIEGLANVDLEIAGGVLDIVFDGTEWQIVGLIDGVYRGSTPPAAPQAVVRWWDTEAGKSYVYFNDGTSSQWVEENVAAVTTRPDVVTKVDVITADQTFVPAANCVGLEIQAVGGGGGGGGVDGQGSGTGASSNGGGGGGTAIKWVDQADLAASYAIVIGAGGAGGASGGNAGADGGATTVVGGSVNLSAGGGFGGPGRTGGGNQLGEGIDGGLATGGDLNIKGGPSGGNSTITGRPVDSQSGASTLGLGVRSRELANGSAATNFGEGGGGTYTVNEPNNRAGGAGGAGVVVIKQYLSSAPVFGAINRPFYTDVTTLSGSSITESVPAWVNKITCVIRAASASTGNSHFGIQIGTGGTLDASNDYEGSVQRLVSAQDPSGRDLVSDFSFDLTLFGGAIDHSGKGVLQREPGTNIWSFESSSAVDNTSERLAVASGHKTLSGPLDIVGLLVFGGETFTRGSVYFKFEE